MKSRPPLGQSGSYIEAQHLSPHGDKVALLRGESKRSGEKVRVSLVSGDEPRWRRDGKEIVYAGGQSSLFGVPVTTSPTFTAGTPQKLFAFKVGGGLGVGHDVTQDGNKLLVIVAEKGSNPSSPVIVNWPAAIKQ